jgi:two-component system, LytTR family, sensor kinase
MLQNKRLITHLIFWTIHIVFAFFAWDLPNYKPGFQVLFSAIIISAHASTVLFFYIHYLYLIPHLLFEKKYVSYFLAVTFTLAIYIVAKAYIWNGFSFIEGLFAEHQRGGVVFSCLFYYTISTAFSMHDYWHDSEQKKMLLLQEVNETELLYLKSQMSPHFLFNTLNNIYGLSLNNNTETSRSISQLKDLMIYVEKFESGNKIALDNEIHYLKSFIALNQLRHNAPIEFNITTASMEESIMIEPMIYLPFIENAFKHGPANGQMSLSINLNATSNKIHFHVKNKISTNKRKDNIGGIGIKNVKRRLELLYPKFHELNTYETNEYFMVDLTLRIV